MLKDITGQCFGRLVVLERAENTADGRTRWKCRCSCGNIAIVNSDKLTLGKTKSCGCLQKEQVSERSTKHGGTKKGNKDRLYCVWSNMIERCHNKNNPSYKNYGKRGIKVCDEWRNDYAAFRAWALANGYNENAKRGQCTLDRINVNGNYSPDNCRWATWKEQQNNKRDNNTITYNGETHTISEWANKTGLKYNTLWRRINKCGWNIEKALNTKVGEEN